MPIVLGHIQQWTGSGAGAKGQLWRIFDHIAARKAPWPWKMLLITRHGKVFAIQLRMIGDTAPRDRKQGFFIGTLFMESPQGPWARDYPTNSIGCSK